MVLSVLERMGLGQDIDSFILKRLGLVGSAQTLYRHLGACFFDFCFACVYND